MAQPNKSKQAPLTKAEARLICQVMKAIRAVYPKVTAIELSMS